MEPSSYSLYPPDAPHRSDESWPPPMRPAPRRLWLHALLFLGAVGTTYLIAGPVYSFWVMLILTCHEFGHYFAAKKHGVKATLPYFIPLPLPPLGTMGAVIRMSPYIPNRRALFDIAVAGPLAGMAVAVPVTIAGIMQAKQVPVAEVAGGMQFGDPLLFRIVERLVLGVRPEGHELVIGPMAFAGWVGLFVTALNLLPISQLDGGHISHAVFGRHSRKVAVGVFAALVAMMYFSGPHYLLILALAWFAGLAHPPTMNDDEGLDRRRLALAALTFVIFVLCFTPKPIVLDWPPDKPAIPATPVSRR